MNLEDFLKEIKKINENGWVKSNRKGSTGVGKTLEDMLGIKENCLPLPDLNSVGELKTIRKDSKSMMTLFTLEPTRHLGDWSSTLKKFGYEDARGRTSLYTTISGSTINAQNMNLELNNDYINLVNLNNNIKNVWASFPLDKVKETFEKKISSNLIVIEAARQIKNGEEFFWYEMPLFLRELSFQKFLTALQEGQIKIDIRVHLKPNGAARSHGTAFRASLKNLFELYETTDNYQFEN